MGRSLAVFAPALAAPGVFLFGCGAGGDDPTDVAATTTTEATTISTEMSSEASTEATTAPTTTTSSPGTKQCQPSARSLATSVVDDGQCQASVYNQDSRPLAATCDTTALSTDECCGACQQDERCDAWVFNTVLNTCSLVMNDAIWVGVAQAQGWVFGAKMKGQCDGCDCGHNPEDMHDMDLRCGDCKGDNWFQYPCFLEKACMCGGDPEPFSTPAPSDGPSTGPEDMFDDNVFDFVALV